MFNKKIVPVCVVAAVTIIGGVHTTYAPKDTKPAGEFESKEFQDSLNFDINVSDADYSGFVNKNIGWGFKKEKKAAPEIDEKTKQMFVRNNTFYIGNQSEKALYLTFDEGYENGYTSVILDVLKEKGVPAAFFITGPYLDMQKELVDRMVNEGHVVGNHTENHPNLAKSDLNKINYELKTLEDKFYQKYNKSMMFMRPPEGEYSEKLLEYASDMGYKTVLWSFAYKDWDINQQKGASYAVDQIIPYLHNGAIILLHAVSSDNAQALGDIIDYAKEQGYEFKSLEEL